MKYKASIKVFGTTFKAQADTLIEALSNLNPKVAKGVSILTVEYNGKEESRILPNLLTQRLFSPSPKTREVNIKQTSLRFSL